MSRHGLSCRCLADDMCRWPSLAVVDVTELSDFSVSASSPSLARPA